MLKHLILFCIIEILYYMIIIIIIKKKRVILDFLPRNFKFKIWYLKGLLFINPKRFFSFSW